MWRTKRKKTINYTASQRMHCTYDVCITFMTSDEVETITGSGPWGMGT